MPLDPHKLLETVHVADGAWGTELRARGSGPFVERANLEQPALVAALAQEYLAAGACFLSTNTFSANRLMLQRRAADLNPADLNSAAVRLAIAARGEFSSGCAVSTSALSQRTGRGRPAVAPGPAAVARSSPAQGGAAARDRWVAGVVGPSGRILAVREVQPGELEAAFEEQIGLLADGGADLIVLETFSELEELLAALRAARRSAPGLPVAACLSFDSGPQRTRTAMGAEAADCARALDQAGADVIGSNCGAGIAESLPALFALRSATGRPVWAKPSAGLPELESGLPAFRVTPDEFIEPITQLLDAGVNVIGGCCGAGPEHIRRAAGLVSARGRTARR